MRMSDKYSRLAKCDSQLSVSDPAVLLQGDNIHEIMQQLA